MNVRILQTNPPTPDIVRSKARKLTPLQKPIIGAAIIMTKLQSLAPTLRSKTTPEDDVFCNTLGDSIIGKSTNCGELDCSFGCKDKLCPDCLILSISLTS